MSNPVIRKLGRRLRLGMIGGGSGAMIGPVHRAAATLDGRFEVVAGVLSSDPAKGRRDAAELGIRRSYDSPDELLSAEAVRDDGIDALAVVTPNDTHLAYAGAALDRRLHVICDKPLTNTLADARSLVRKVEASGRVFCLTHNYSGYPMVREARARVRAGELGPVRLVHVVYAQGSLAARVEHGDIPKRLRWRLDPSVGGASHVLLDIGTHAHQLATFITGQQVSSVMAEVGAVLPGRAAHDTASALLRFDGGARGVLWTTKAAAGAENALTIEVYGEEGGLAFEQTHPNHLRLMRRDAAPVLLSRGQPGLSEAAARATRIPSGHPEGFHEAFANLYADFADAVAASLTGEAADPLALDFPTVHDGARGVAFVEACLRSTASGRWADCAAA
ncbi:MAG TPA: Gfo/Idh/MocA family oxidoreductase [Geminicoccaceae bacterium]